MYGVIPPEDTDANNADLKAGEGRVLARFREYGKLEGDIYIIAAFSQGNPGKDYNNTTILYCSEY